jgi:hypothetical protein
VKVSYFAGLAAHVLSGHPDVAKVETLADAGVDGKDWHPSWLKVTLTNGTSMVLSVVRQPSDNEAPDKPDMFHPEDLDGSQRQVPGLQGQHVG